MELDPSTDLHLVPLYGAHIPDVLKREPDEKYESKDQPILNAD